MLKRDFFISWCFSALCLFASNAQSDAAQSLPILQGVGGDFSAIGDNGKPFHLNTYKNKVVVLFFGYTNCADVCPFTLGYLKDMYQGLTEQEQQQVQVVFVSIDPEYDTPEHLHEYVRYFNRDFVGVTGNKKAIDAIVKQYQVKYSRTSGKDKVKTKDIRRVTQKAVENEEEDAAYVYSHTVNLYLMDAQLRVRSLDYTGTAKPVLRNKIRQLIKELPALKTADKRKAKVSQAPVSGVLPAAALTTVALKKPAKVNMTLPIAVNYWVHLGPPNTRTMAAYGEFINTGEKDIYLMGFSNKDFSQVQMHESVIDKQGIGKMVEHKTFLIPAGESLEFAPGSKHIMLITPLKRFKHNGQTSMQVHYRQADSAKIVTQTLLFPVRFDGAACTAMPQQ